MTAEDLILARTADVAEKAGKLFGLDLSGLQIQFDLRGMAAGQIQLRKNLLRYNLTIAERQIGEFIAHTVPHEVAHLVCYRLHGQRVRPHGPEWRQICLALGGNGERCHGFEATPARQVRRYNYLCGCRTWTLSSVRIKRMRRGVTYCCRKCGESLRPEG
jgi:SprT protein